MHHAVFPFTSLIPSRKEKIYVLQVTTLIITLDNLLTLVLDDFARDQFDLTRKAFTIYHLSVIIYHCKHNPG